MNRRVHDSESLGTDLRRMASLVLHHLEQALSCFHTLDLEQADGVIERDDMINNFNIFLEGRCYELVASGHLDGRGIRVARATAKVAANLERAGDAGTHIAKRVRLIHREGAARLPFDFPDVEAIALSAMTEAAQSFLEADLELARRACLREPELDGCYVARLEELSKLMQANPVHIPYLLQCLSVLKYLEKVADYTLNIGEQTIYCVTGRRLKFPQYLQLERLAGEAHIAAYDFRPYWDGISGAIVARVEAPETPEAPMIYKEGSRRKIEEEAAKFATWQRIAQDLTPRILGSVSVKDRQALLREYVEGALLSDLYLSSTALEMKLRATRRVLAAVEFVWQTTLTPTPPCSITSSRSGNGSRMPSSCTSHSGRSPKPGSRTAGPSPRSTRCSIARPASRPSWPRRFRYGCTAISTPTT